MKYEVLEQMISSYMRTAQPVYYFGWQGGEPTLMGLAFFEKVVEFQTKYGPHGAIVSNGLQTNATRINDSSTILLRHYWQNTNSWLASVLTGLKKCTTDIALTSKGMDPMGMFFEELMFLKGTVWNLTP
jgi:hypothetical protein